MKIVVVASSFFPRWGGTENQARRQAEEYARRGHEIHVVTWRHDPHWLAEERLSGVMVHRVDRSRGSLRSAVTMAATLVRFGWNADAIVAHQLLLTAYLAGAVSLLTRASIVVKPAITAAATDSCLRPLVGPAFPARLRRLMALPIRRWGVVVAMTAEIEDDVTRLRFRRVVRIPNGCVGSKLPDRDRLRAELYEPLGVSRDIQVVGAAGRFVDWKGFDVLLDAWALCTSQVPNLRLILVGSGPEEPALRRRTEVLGVGLTVSFVSATPRAADYLAAADAVVLPSDFEGMSNILLESMAAARPVVATRVSGAVDLIRDRENGRLVAKRDPEALAAAIVDVLRDPETLGEQARLTVLEACDMQSVVDLYERVFANANTLPYGTVSAEQLARYPMPAGKHVPGVPRAGTKQKCSSPAEGRNDSASAEVM